MPDPGEARVAVYLDFDNIVIGRYDQVHGRGAYQRDRSRAMDRQTDRSPASDRSASDRGADRQQDRSAEADFTGRLEQATVDIGAIIDFASSFGTLVLTRAYADWSASVNAAYREQLVGRAVDLVQLFPAAAYAKNGADIRLAVDAVEDMFRLPDLTHVVIVAGDSDYIALAQRCKRLGRYVVGVGVAGSTARSLGAACDELVTYDALPGVQVPDEPGRMDDPPARRRGRRVQRPSVVPDVVEPDEDEPDDPQAVATDLLDRALRLGRDADDADWQHTGTVKTQMKRMDPSFSERALGYRTFSDFLHSRGDLIELDEDGPARLVRLVPAPPPEDPRRAPLFVAPAAVD